MEQLRNEKKIILNIGNHGLLFVQILNKGNYFMETFENYKQVFEYLQKNNI